MELEKGLLEIVSYRLLKIISERPRDREDVEGVFRQQGSKLDFLYLDLIVHELGEALGRSDIVEFYEAMKRAVRR